MNPALTASLMGGALLIAVLSGCSQDTPENLLSKAKVAFENKEYKTTEIHLKNLLQSQDNGAARLLLARAHLANEEWVSAQKEFRRAIVLGVDSDQAIPGLLEATFQADSPEKVIEQSGKQSLDDPQAQAVAHFWTGRAWAKLGDLPKSAQSYEAALQADPELVKAQVGLLGVRVRGDLKALPRTLEELEAIISKIPDSHDALMLQAELRIASGDHKGAQDSLQKITAKWPADLLARSMLAQTHLALNDRESARNTVLEILKLAPKWPVALTQRAQLDLLDGNREAARDGALEALSAAPEYVPALAIAGSSQLALGSLEQAENYARTLIKLYPSGRAGHRLLAAVQLKRGEFQRARQTVEPLLARGANDPELIMIAGEAALREGDAAASKQFFAKAAELDKDNSRSRVGLAFARMGTGDRTGAMLDLQAASSMDDQSTLADLALVSMLIGDRQFDRALKAIGRLEQKGSHDGEAEYLRGQVALAQGDSGKGRSQFEQALKAKPTLLPALTSLAALDIKEGRLSDARQRFETFVTDNPKSAQGLLALAKLSQDDKEDPKQVLELLKRARTADPDNETAAVALAVGLVGQGQLREAVQVLQDATAQHPAWDRALEALASAQIRAGDPGRAAETIEKVVRLKSDDFSAQFRMGVLRSVLRDFNGALELFRRAQTLKPDALEPPVNIATTLARLGRTDEALASARDIQKRFADKPAGWILEGEILRTRQQWAEAAGAFRKALALDPAQRGNALKLHNSLIRAGKSEEADKLLQSWLKESPSDEALNLYAGESDLLARRFEDAVKRFDAVVAANPRNAIAQNNLAWALFQIKDGRALSVARKAYELAPESAPVVDTLATILSGTNEKERGIEMHRKAASLAPKSPDLLLKLALALKDGGDKEQARAELDRVIKEFPNTPQAETASRLRGEL